MYPPNKPAKIISNIAPTNRTRAALLINKRVSYQLTNSHATTAKSGIVGIPYRDGLFIDKKFIKFADIRQMTSI